LATDLRTLNQIRNHLVECIKKKEIFEKARFPVGLDFKTKAGLPWIPVCDLTLGKYKDVKLDITFRTFLQHETIQNHVKKAFIQKFPTEQSKFDYIQTQHQFARIKKELSQIHELLKSTEDSYCKNKSWLTENLTIPAAI
jgi:hypothetical protein